MAFVYRNSKDGPQGAKKISSGPGPGQYEHQNAKKSPKLGVSFADTCVREIWAKSITPGPGQYRSEENELMGGTNISPNVNGFIIEPEICNPTSAFKSKSKRLLEGKICSPGPGEYNIAETKKLKNSKKGIVSVKPTKLARYLFEENKRQLERFYDKDGFDHSFLGQEPNQVQTPKSPEPEKKLKTSSFASKVQRDKLIRPQTTKAGPGSYQIAESFNFLDRKPIHLEKKDYRENQMRANVLKKWLQCTAQSNGDYQFKGKQNVGPGSYDIKNSGFIRNNPSVSKGIACFGSKQSRFTNKAQRKSFTPGPQTYAKSKTLNQQNQVSKKTVAFNSGTEKDFKYSVSQVGTSQNISPVSYVPKNDFEDLLKRNYLKGSIGNFGSTVERFKKKDDKIQEVKARNKSQKNLEICTAEFKEPKKINYSKQKLRKKIQKRVIVKFGEEDQRPLCYDNQYQTISQKYQTKMQKNAPFMTAAGRFESEQQNFQYELFDELRSMDEEKLKIRGQSASSGKRRYRGVRKGSAMAKFRNCAQQESQFKKSKSKQEGRLATSGKEDFDVGPQSYDPKKPLKGKSYNVLFNKN